MFLIKIFHFFKGYVIISIKGHNKEEFISFLAKNGIKIIETSVFEDEIQLRIFAGDFLKLKSFHPKCRIHLIKKCGIGFLLKNTRKSLVIVTAIFASVFVLSSQFVWDVTYEGVDHTDLEQLQNATRLAGIHPGMLRCNIKSGYEMKDIILNNTENICWAWVYEKGTRIVVKVRENIIPPEVFDPDVPCDIIAARSGIIRSVLTIRGKCVAENNMAVAPGDTIISGTYQFENQPGYQVHSAGVVKAETEHVRSGIYKQFYCYKKYTGRKRFKPTIHIFGLDIPLYIKKDVSFERYDELDNRYDIKWGEHYSGVGVSVKTVKEFIEEKEPISFESAVDFAEKELEKKIAGELLFGAELLDKRTDTEKIDEETVKVTVTMKFIEEIGTEKRIDEVTQVEPKTDRTATGD